MEGQRRRLNVLVVDDSAVVRQALSTILSLEPDIVVQSASDPLIAEQKMAHFAPDVILLDLEMPRMDGLTFLRKLMDERPIPVVVCSSYAEDGSDAALRALELGAVDIIPKPRMAVREFLHDSAVMLVESVRGAAMARVRGQAQARRHGEPRPRLYQTTQARVRMAAEPGSPVPKRNSADAGLPAAPAPWVGPEVEPVIAVGASTGGTEALRTLLDAMPADGP